MKKLAAISEETKVLQKVEAICGPITQIMKLLASPLHLEATPSQIWQLAELDDVTTICWADQPVELIKPVKS